MACRFYFIRLTGSGRYWIGKLSFWITGFLMQTLPRLKLCLWTNGRSNPLFINSRTKVLSGSEFHRPRPVTSATNALFPSDTKPELKNLLSGWRLQELQGKTAITGRRGEKLNTGKLLPRAPGGHGKMILSFLSLLKYLSLAPGTIGSCVLVPFLLYAFLYFRFF